MSEELVSKCYDAIKEGRLYDFICEYEREMNKSDIVRIALELEYNYADNMSFSADLKQARADIVDCLKAVWDD